MKHQQGWERVTVGVAVVVVVFGWGLAGGAGLLAAMFLSFSIMLVVAGFRGETQALPQNESAAASHAKKRGDFHPTTVARDPGEPRPALADHAVTA